MSVLDKLAERTQTSIITNPQVLLSLYSSDAVNCDDDRSLQCSDLDTVRDCGLVGDLSFQ